MRRAVLLAAMAAIMLAVAAPAFAQEEAQYGVAQYEQPQYEAAQYQYAGYVGEAYEDVQGLTVGECAQIVQQANAGYVGQAQYGYRYVPQYQYGIVADVDLNGDGYIDESDDLLAQEQALIDANLQPSPVEIQACQDTVSTVVMGDEDGGAPELPATSGISLLTLGAGVLLVAGGLVTRLFVRR